MKLKEGDPNLLFVENENDLALVRRLIRPGDIIGVRTTRIFRVGKREEKKAVRIRMRVEKINYGRGVRLLGVILEGSPEEYVPRGRHHSVDVVPGVVVALYRPLHAEEKRWIRRFKAFDLWAVLVDDSEYSIWHDGVVAEGRFREGDQYDWSFLSLIPKGAEVIVAGVPPWRDMAAKRLEGRRVHKINAHSFEEAFSKADLRELRLVEEIAAYERLSKALAHDAAVFGGEIEEAIAAGNLAEFFTTEEFFREKRELCLHAVDMGAHLLVVTQYEPMILLLRSFKGAAGIKRF